MINPTSNRIHDAKIERERLMALINSMADGVIAFDKDAKVIFTNGAALDILDVNGIVAGKSISSIVQLYDVNNQPIRLKSVIKNTEHVTSTRDWRLQYDNGDKINLYVSISPVRLGFGREDEIIGGHVMIIRDITREKSLEEERDEFISVVSHELRTPIAIAEGNIGNAEFLADKTGDLQQIKNALKQAHEQIIFLAGLMNDLATLSRAERGKLEIDIEPINVTSLLQELSADYLNDAAQKGLRLNVEASREIELLYSSRLYVKEILQNFITNAIKYTQEGSVNVSAKPTKNGVVFDITDTGIGISKADQEKIFDKFYRSEDFRTRQSSGTGLGLYVTTKLARMLHAEIDLKSDLNAGSTFTVLIPNLQ